MRHTPLDQLGDVATVFPELRRATPMSRKERLDRWATLLDRQQERWLATLAGTEYESGETLAAMRSQGSPISVAFEDPLLRAEGLKDDTYGEAKRFFDLTDWWLHAILCHCHFGAEMSAKVAAKRVRAASVERSVPAFVVPMRNIIGG